MRRVLLPLFAALAAGACSSQNSVADFGVQPSELACLSALYIDVNTKTPAFGGVHVTNPATARALSRRIRWLLPEVRIVGAREDADFVVQVITLPETICVDCDSGPDTKWSALLFRPSAPVLVPPSVHLEGRMRIGSDPLTGFVCQLRGLTRAQCHRRPKSVAADVRLRVSYAGKRNGSCG